jgi:hypothetical protein
VLVRVKGDTLDTRVMFARHDRTAALFKDGKRVDAPPSLAWMDRLYRPADAETKPRSKRTDVVALRAVEHRPEAFEARLVELPTAQFGSALSDRASAAVAALQKELDPIVREAFQQRANAARGIELIDALLKPTRRAEIETRLDLESLEEVASSSRQILHELLELTESGKLGANHPRAQEYATLIDFARGEYRWHSSRIDMLKSHLGRLRAFLKGLLGYRETLVRLDKGAALPSERLDHAPLRILGTIPWTKEADLLENGGSETSLYVSQDHGAISMKPDVPMSAGYSQCKTLLLHNPWNGLYAYAHVVADLNGEQMSLSQDLGPGPKSAIWLRGEVSRPVYSGDEEVLAKAGYSTRQLELPTGQQHWSSWYSTAEDRLFAVNKKSREIVELSGFYR